MLKELEYFLGEKREEIDAWFAAQWKGMIPGLYLSCDIRHSGHKIAVVDTNVFPAGFNNLCHAFSDQTSAAFADYLNQYYPGAKKILIMAEDHTRNRFYLEHIHALASLLQNASYETAVGMLGTNFSGDQVSISLDKTEMPLWRVKRKNDSLFAGPMRPDLILLNNDLSGGEPEILKNTKQPVIPAPRMGWHARNKHRHFEITNALIGEFCSRFTYDPWQLSLLFDHVAEVDLDDEKSIEGLAYKVDHVLVAIRKKYASCGIKEQSFVYLKNDRGTYGMGLLPVFSADDIIGLGRRKKNKLLSAKAGVKTTHFLIQEGVRTADTYSGYPIEPVIYAVGNNPVGGFFRLHEAREEWESLNAPGMSFSCLCLHKLNEPHETMFIDCAEKESLVNVAMFLTRIACLAVARE